MFQDSGIDDYLASTDGAGETVPLSNGYQVRMRPVGLLELGDIASDHPLFLSFMLGAKGGAGMSDEGFIAAALKNFRGGVSMLVAASAGRPGDRAVADALSHKPDEDFWKMAGAAHRLTFPLGVKGKVAEMVRHLAQLGIKLPFLDDQLAQAPSNSAAQKPSSGTGKSNSGPRPPRR